MLIRKKALLIWYSPAERHTKAKQTKRSNSPQYSTLEEATELGREAPGEVIAIEIWLVAIEVVPH